MNLSQLELLLELNYQQKLINMKSNIDIVVIHDDIKKYSVLITKLKESFEKVEIIDDPHDGISYVVDHLAEKIIVVLDIDFGEDEINGYDVLKKIRERSYLVEVIILSARDLPNEGMLEHINQLFGLKAFDYVIRGKPKWQDKLQESILRAKTEIENSIDSTIEDWILKNKNDKDKPVYITTNGDSYSLNDILNEIRLQTIIGKDFTRKMNSLTIDLLLRNKESL